MLATLCLCLGLQPCALAALGDAECPHGAAAHAESTDALHEHHAQGGVAEKADCATAKPSCCAADDGAVDGRASFSKFKDGGQIALLLPAAERDLWQRSSGSPEPYPDRVEVRASGPPLHKRFCVYLD